LKLLIDRPDGAYCFREKKDRVYYVSEKILRLATTVAPDNLLSVGTCIGKFTKSGKFRLHITALHYLAPYAKVNNIFYILILSFNLINFTLNLFILSA
jgi:60S ribosome subunit biogenesis protein NIP7